MVGRAGARHCRQGNQMSQPQDPATPSESPRASLLDKLLGRSTRARIGTCLVLAPFPLALCLILFNAYWPQVGAIALDLSINRSAVRSTVAEMGAADPLAGTYVLVRVVSQYWIIASTMIALASRLLWSSTAYDDRKMKAVWWLLAIAYGLPGTVVFLYPGLKVDGLADPMDGPVVMAAVLLVSGFGAAVLCYFDGRLLPRRSGA